MDWFSLKRLLSNPMGLFVYGLFSKWYLMITITALIVTFWVFKGLEQAGVLQAAEVVVSKALNDTKAVARYCIPKITNIKDFWECLNNPPKYEPSKQDKELWK